MFFKSILREPQASKEKDVYGYSCISSRRHHHHLSSRYEIQLLSNQLCIRVLRGVDLKINLLVVVTKGEFHFSRKFSFIHFFSSVESWTWS